MAFKLPPLPYDFGALEPYIDAQTMEIHHDKHHKKYVDELNAALEKHPELQKKSLVDLISNLDAVPEDIRTAVRNNGGGTYNHDVFWLLMSPNGGKPKGKAVDAIKKKFGTFEAFQEKFNNEAKTRFGSGWAWLSLDKNGDLVVSSTPNQDTPVMQGLKPIMGLDVWEHAYYLKYQNRRPDYISAWWHVVDWEYVEERYTMLVG
ncbi:MAG: superoxide dismutase [Candidatus Babeliales bacterium]